MPISIDSLRAFIAALAARPGMWLGRTISLHTFAAAIAGYETALYDASVVPPAGLPVSHQFSGWLSNQWKASSVVGWQALVEERFGCDAAAVAEAAKLIEQWFCARNAEI